MPEMTLKTTLIGEDIEALVYTIERRGQTITPRIKVELKRPLFKKMGNELKEIKELSGLFDYDEFRKTSKALAGMTD